MLANRIYLSPPHMSQFEQAFVLDAFESNWIAPLGPHVDAFERELAERVGVKEAVATSSGTAALHLAMILLGVGPGDEVLTSTLTFSATANAITYVGAKPVFIDSDKATWNMNPDLLANELRACARERSCPRRSSSSTSTVNAPTTAPSARPVPGTTCPSLKTRPKRSEPATTTDRRERSECWAVLLQRQ